MSTSNNAPASLLADSRSGILESGQNFLPDFYEARVRACSAR